MFMVPGIRARPPLREAIINMYSYHPDRAPWLVTKTQESVVYYEKVTMQIDFINNILCRVFLFIFYNIC